MLPLAEYELADGEAAEEAVVVGDTAVLVETGLTTLEDVVIGQADPVPTGKVVDGEADCVTALLLKLSEEMLVADLAAPGDVGVEDEAGCVVLASLELTERSQVVDTFEADPVVVALAWLVTPVP